MSNGSPQVVADATLRSGARGTTRRVFFALWPDEEQRIALARAMRNAVRRCGGRPLPAENLHVTLAFLGSVSQGRVADLGGIGQRVAAAFAARAPALTWDRLAHWPRPQLLCALAADPLGGEPSGAAILATTLKQETAAAGFSPDLKPFRAHVTVARKVAHAPAAQLQTAVEWRFVAFALIDSTTAPAGSIYSVIDSYSLVNAQNEC